MEFLFLLFKTLALFSAIGVVTTRNPIHSVLFLISTFLNVSALLVLFRMEFMALTYIVVYVGAIAVLFLFVIMMLDIRVAEITSLAYNYILISALILTIIGTQFTNLFLEPFSSTFPSTKPRIIDLVDPLSNIIIIGQFIYLYAVIPFIMLGFILLIVMLGAIMITMGHDEENRRQNTFEQSDRLLGNAVQRAL